jgi:single-stranded-DNA-specific exonuclease
MTSALLGVEQSALGRKWLLRSLDDGLVGAHQRAHGVSDMLARVLAARNLSVEAAPGFLNPTLRTHFPDPSCFADMDRAAAVVLDALENNTPCMVFADYDVDGASAGALLVRYFRAMGRTLPIYVPDRMAEGYGPTPYAFRRIREAGADLVITVDCGATSYEAATEAAKIGLGLVVVDHHLMQGPPPPEALAVVNPNRPDCPSPDHCKGMTAVGVAYVLCAAINRLARQRGLFGDSRIEPDMLQWLDLVAMGAVCDVAPLLALNRAYVAQGLKVMARWQNAGLKALADAGRMKGLPVAKDIGWTLGPRINAGGRIGRADVATRLLASDDPAEIAELSAELDNLNTERRGIEKRALDAAIDLIERRSNFDPDDPVVVAAGEGWHPGVVGIVAGRLRERYRKPSVVIGIDNGLGHGSGRSSPGVNLGAAIAAAKDAGLLISGGGHAMAAGLKIKPENIPEFRAFMVDALAVQTHAAKDMDALIAEGLASIPSVSVKAVEELQKLEPFGPGNPEPLFVIPHARVQHSMVMKGGHLRLTLADEAGKTMTAIAFRAAEGALAPVLALGAVAHVAGVMTLNTWGGRSKAELRIEDAADPQRRT